MITDELYIATNYVSWDYTKYIVFSSLFFMVPAVYAYTKSLYLYTAMLSSTSLMSINYWKKATFSWRRTLDVINAHTMIAIFGYNGLVIKNNIYIKVFSFTIFGSAIYLYTLSDKYRLVKYIKPTWYRYHMTFHAFSTIFACMVIHYL